MKFPGRPRDTVPAMLRPGEGVLVPEATQMLGGARGINALNRGAEARMVRTAGRGILARHVTPPPRMPVQHFTGGGIVYDDWGHPLDSDATPSSYTSPTGQGPLDGQGGGWTPPGDLNGGAYADGSNPNSMAPYDPNYPYGSTGSGSGVPTQKFAGFLGSLLGGGAGALVPGGSLFGAKAGGWAASALAKYLQNQRANRPVGGGQQGGGQRGPGGGGSNDRSQMARLPGYFQNLFSGLPEGFTEQRNKIGEFGAPNFYGPGGPGQGPQFTGDSIFNANQGPFNNASAGAFWSPPGGSIGGPLGVGSAGDIGWNYFGGQGLKALMQGGDTSLGFAGFQNANAGGGAPILPMSQWGGIGAGGMGGSNVQGGTITQRFKSQV